MEPLIADLRAALAGNEFFAGGFILMLMSAVLVSLRKTPSIIAKWLQRQLSVAVEVRDPYGIRWLDHWLSAQPYGRRCRLLKMGVGRWGDQGELPEIVLSPGFGIHLVRWEGCGYLIRRKLEDGRKPGAGEGGGGLLSMIKQELVWIHVLGRSPEPARALLAEACRYYERDRRGDELRIYVNRRGDWWSLSTVQPRSPDSVVLAGGMMAAMIADADRFLSEDRRRWYRDRGLNYRRGYMFSGPPRNGKSSAVRALASELKLPLYWLDLTQEKLCDVDLAGLMATVPPKAIVFVEDVDRVPICRTDHKPGPLGESDSRVTLSGLLNAVDGIVAGEGRILVITANHPEILQPALIGEGRIDRAWTIDNPVTEQARRIFLRFFPGEERAADRFARALPDDGATSMGALQEVLIRHAEDPGAACMELERRATGAVPAPLIATNGNGHKGATACAT